MALLPVADEEYTQETREAAPAHLRTKIKSFSMLWKHKITELESMEFEAGNHKWKVRINLDGGNHISVNLCLAGTNSLRDGWEVHAMFNFILYNHISDKYHCFRGKARRFHAINPECVLSNLMTKKCLTEPSNGYIFKDKCVFGADVFVIKNKPLIEKVSVHQLSIPYKHQWKISGFSKLEGVWKSEEFSAGGYKWEIEMDPNGSLKTGGRYVSIFLFCVDAKSFGNEKKANVACRFCLRNKLGDGNDHSYEAIGWFTSTCSGWGTNQFIAIDDMRDSSKGFVVDDCCILEMQLSVQALQKAPYDLVIR